MSNIAICIAKQHPKVNEISLQMKEMKEKHLEELQELKKVMEEKAKFHKRGMKILQDKLELALTEEDLMPSEYEKGNEKHAIHIAEGVVMLHIHDTSCGHNLPEFLKFLFND